MSKYDFGAGRIDPECIVETLEAAMNGDPIRMRAAYILAVASDRDDDSPSSEPETDRSKES